METVLYADILFLVNFAMDFISLSAAASLGAVPKKPLRLCISSAIGALYGVVATVWKIGGVPGYIPTALVSGAMCIIGFGYSGIIPFIRQCIIFWGCGALLGGTMTAVLSFGENALSISIIIPTAIAGCLVLFFVIRAVSWRAGCKDMKICITYKGKSITFRALCDSGNLIRDPFSGKPVIIISRDELSMLLGTVATNALMTCDTEVLRSLGIMPRIIPRGSEKGHDLMCAFSPEKAVITTDRRSMERDVLIAPANTPRGYYAGYPATAPSLLIP